VVQFIGTVFDVFPRDQQGSSGTGTTGSGYKAFLELLPSHRQIPGLRIPLLAMHPPTSPVHGCDPPASIEDLAHTELEDVDIPHNLRKDGASIQSRAILLTQRQTYSLVNPSG
jgi:hypothetical protein